MMTPWSSLPADVQELVLAQLLPGELTRVRTVCRQWKSATDSPTFRHVYRREHPAVKPSLLLYNHAVQISGLQSGAAWQNMSVPAAYVREWAGAGGFVCLRSHLDNYTVGCPFSNTWSNLPAPPKPPTAATLTKLWAVVATGARFWVVLLHRTFGSLSLSVFDSDSNQWTKDVSDGHLLSSLYDTGHTVGSVIYSIQPKTRRVVALDVRRNRWMNLGGDNFLPSDLVFEVKQRVDDGDGGVGAVLVDTPPAVVDGHRGKLCIIGASAEAGMGTIWELDRVAMVWRVVGKTPAEMWTELVEEAAVCRKGDLLLVRFSGYGEVAVIMAAGARRGVQYDVIRGTWSWLELPPSVNCDLNVCFHSPHKVIL